MPARPPGRPLRAPATPAATATGPVLLAAFPRPEVPTGENGRDRGSRPVHVRLAAAPGLTDSRD